MSEESESFDREFRDEVNERKEQKEWKHKTKTKKDGRQHGWEFLLLSIYLSV